MAKDLKLISIGSQTRGRLLLVRLVLRREVGFYWSDWFSDGRSAPIAGHTSSRTRGRLLLVSYPPACRALVSPEGEPSPLLPPPPSPCLKTIEKSSFKFNNLFHLFLKYIIFTILVMIKCESESCRYITRQK